MFNNIPDSSNVLDSSAGLSVDMTNPAHAAYAGAAVIGATAVVGSVALTTIAAPGLVLIPAAFAGGLVATGHYISNNNATDADAPAKRPQVSDLAYSAEYDPTNDGTARTVLTDDLDAVAV